MTTAVRLAAFGTALAVAFGAAWGIGTATGLPAFAAAPAAPVEDPAAHVPAGPDATGQDHAAHDPLAPGPGPADPATGHDDGHDASGPASAAGSDGLTSTAAGYTLVPQVTTFTPGTPAELAYAITGSDGKPVTAFDTGHEKQMHTIVVRRDAAGFQHVHPALGADGIWRVPLALPAAGVYRLYADFTPTGGPPLVLGTDLFASGDFDPIAFSPSRVAQVDGYQVRLDGELVPGEKSQVFATVSRDGTAVTDLQPYLGAFGHLVALRRSDLAFLHVHPDAATPAPTDRAGPGIAFTAEVPTPGSYRLFLDFRHGDVVRTAEFTIDTRTRS